MQAAARILIANPVELQLEERAAEIPSIGPDNDREYECPHCRDSGWRQVDLPGRAGMRQCECVAVKARARYLALIPELGHTEKERVGLTTVQGYFTMASIASEENFFGRKLFSSAKLILKYSTS